MTGARQRAYFKLRVAINATNVLVLSRLNGSTVVSGFPKTGTTYLSHIAEQATGRPYIEGSMRLALRPSVVHTHSRRGPRTTVYSFRPIEKVIPSFTTQRITETDRALLGRIRAGELDKADRRKIREIAWSLLAGTPRLPSPSRYYQSVAAAGGIIVNVVELAGSHSPSHARLEAAWGVSPEALSAAIARASALSNDRRNSGHEFYNRPSGVVFSVLASDRDLSAAIWDEAARTEAIIRDQNID